MNFAGVAQKICSKGFRLMRFPTYPRTQEKAIRATGDPVRYASISLALARIETENIPGSLAEVGIWKGTTSRFIHSQVPHRIFHLFDTFCGFPENDLETSTRADSIRFRDTSMDAVRNTIGDTRNVIFHPGYFPETTKGLECERFAFAMLDVDLYKPTIAALEFFYPRIERGGYIFLHDYNSPESDHAIRRAVDPFLADKPERLIDLPDLWGSTVFRKM